MKKLFTIVALICICSSGIAQVKKFTIDGQVYYGTKNIPEDIIGKYLYESKKEPIVDVQKGDMAGKFQVHGVPAYPASYWVQTDEKGVVQMRKSEVNKNYQVVLIMEYGDNGEAGWKGENKGKLDRIEATVNFEDNTVIILGERFKPRPGSY